MHTYFHTTLGFCLWDLLALVVLAAVVAMLLVHMHENRKRQKELEQEIAEQNASRQRAVSGSK